MACIVVFALVAAPVRGAQDPAPPPPPPPPPAEPAPSKPRYIPPPPPTAEDIEAWERLWRGDGSSPPSPASPAPTPPTPAPPAPPADPAKAAPSLTTAAAARTRMDELVDTYAAGDTAVISREFRSSADFQRHRPDLMDALARWRSDWSRARAAFALDIALTAFAQRWPQPGRFLAAARDIVTARPDPLGANAEDDRFEERFHRAAVAVLAALHAPGDVLAYLDAIDARVATTADSVRDGRPVDPRLLLARGTAREAMTLPIQIAAATRSEDERRTWVAAGNGEARRRLRDALAMFDLAAQHDATRDEAHIRRAFVLHRLGDDEAALTALDAAAESPDDILSVWRELIRGRVLSALGRHGDAASAYEQAAALAPGTQTPAVALAAAYLRLGRREDALQWAARARSTDQDRADPWTLYWMGDGRFLPVWLDEIRRTSP